MFISLVQIENPRNRHFSMSTSKSPACCTCATLLSTISPQYDEKSEKPLAHDRWLECCGRVICGNCIAVRATCPSSRPGKILTAPHCRKLLDSPSTVSPCTPANSNYIINKNPRSLLPDLERCPLPIFRSTRLLSSFLTTPFRTTLSIRTNPSLHRNAHFTKHPRETFHRPTSRRRPPLPRSLTGHDRIPRPAL